MLYLAGITISLFLGFVLLSKKDKSLADKVLAVWLLVIAFHLFQFYLFISGNMYEYPALLGTGLPLPLLHGPFLFLYVVSLTGRVNKIGFKEILHFAPAILSYLYLVSYFIQPAGEKIIVFQHKGQGYETYLFLNLIAIPVSGVVYVLWSILLLRKHRLAILDQFSYTEKINLDWLRYLIYGIALIWVFVILSMDTLVYGTAVLFVIFIGVFGIRQTGIFGPPSPQGGSSESAEAAIHVSLDEEAHKGEILPEVPVKKYSKSGLTEEAATRIHQQLSELMASEKLFCESELTLASLAARLNTAPNYLSQVINEREGKNFYDYVNTLRVEEFKRAAENPENRKFTLLAMAYDCGFNSKSSFNKYFRKITGVAPMEYMRSEVVAK